MMSGGNALPLLAVEDLSIEFRTRSGTVRALDKVGFELHRGETLALVGESGSGKSVTAYAIMGILDPAARITSGRIMFGSLDLLQTGLRAIAEIRGRELAIIFQNPRTALNPIRPVGSRSPRYCCGTAMSPATRHRDAPKTCWRKCAFPIRSGARAPIRSSCREGCVSGS